HQYRDRRGPKKVVHNHYYEEPARERVVVVERPVYYEQPRYEEPPRYYRDEPAYYPPADSGYRSATPMVVGGIIGGVLGNQVGKGRGKDLATVAGVILGGSIGRDMGYRQ
ncbi:MAG: glycine zipper 2TM domain-containing protein, partial [Thiohalobacteraceae bacterium]